MTVDFNGGESATFYIDGTIKSPGTTSNPIVFTSRQALSMAGVPGQYFGIKVSSGNASSRFSYTHFYYGGRGSGGYYAYAELAVESHSTVGLDHDVFEDNEYSGVEAWKGTVNLSNSTIAHNGGGLTGFETFHVSHSMISDNTADGVFIYEWPGATAGSSFDYNTIVGNGAQGVHVGQSCETQLSGFPHGEYNNIYDNGPANGTNDQLGTEDCNALPVDWANNYWGPEVSYYYNTSRCAGRRARHTRVFLRTRGPDRPIVGRFRKGPLRKRTTFMPRGQNTFECGRNPVKIGPGEFQHAPIENRVPELDGLELFGAASLAVPNLRKIYCGDPVDCGTGNLDEPDTDSQHSRFEWGFDVHAGV